MQLHSQIKRYRTEANLSQEELAEQVYVTRQTVSNWETGKSYPDIHSLLLLSNLFGVSLDTLIKGDIEIMRQAEEKEVKRFRRYHLLFRAIQAAIVLYTFPLVLWDSPLSSTLFFFLGAAGVAVGAEVTHLQKSNDIYTYKEIMAFCEGKRLDELSSIQEIAKRPYQSALELIISILLVLVASMIAKLLV